MAITPISPSINLPILSESVNIDIAPTSQFGQPYDIARITTLIQLTSPLSSPQKFLLPSADKLWSPKMTLEDGTELQYTLDGVDVGALESLKQEYRAKTEQFLQDPSNDPRNDLKELADKIFQLSQYTTVEEVPSGTQLIKFSFTKPINRDASGVFVLEDLVPMASFSMQNGSRVHALVAMPFSPNVPMENVESTWTSPNNTVDVLHENNLDNRTILTYYWQQDPRLTIRYHY